LGADEAALGALAAHPDTTLAAHCALWHANHGERVSVPKMGRALRRLGVTRQQSP
jgi:hypothetical protein